MKVRLTKITGSFDSDQHVGYWIEGVLLGPVVEGRPLRVLRSVRNGVEALGLFVSSEVCLIEGNFYHTENSVWKMERLED